MNTIFRRSLISLALIAATSSAFAFDSDSLVAIKNGKLHVIQTGSGANTVIIESGFVSDMSEWRQTVAAIAKDAQVVIYSRAGNGQSPARNHALTLTESTQELGEMIQASKLKGPFIFVGHSYGGFIVRQYAAQHPEQVAALVLVDPATEEIQTKLKKIDPIQVKQEVERFTNSAPPQWKQAVTLVQQIFEAGKLPSTSALPDVTTALLTSVKPTPNNQDISLSSVGIKIKRELHTQFLQQFSNTTHYVSNHSGHFMQREEPQLVIQAINHTINAVNVEQAMKTAKKAKQEAQQQVMQALEKANTALQNKQRDSAKDIMQKSFNAVNYSEADVNNLGYMMLTQAKQAQLAELVFAVNLDRFSQSDNAHDSYGEVLLELKQAAQAKTHFLKAIELGKANPKRSPNTIAGFEKNLQKAQAALSN
jgi:pimeloyl-ACP methyl ester carboxylesterase